MSNSQMVVTDLQKRHIQYFAPAQAVAEDVWVFAAFANVFALETADSLVLVDTGLVATGRQLVPMLQKWSDKPISTIILTHGHADHIGGLKNMSFDDEVMVIGQDNILKRIERYEMTQGWNAKINQIQFGLAEPVFARTWIGPTHTFHEQETLQVGDTTLELYAAKGETDDMCYTWVPEKRYLFCGDLFEWTMPNAGNPQKVQRYPLEWAEALENMAALKPAWLFPGHGFVLQGEEIIQTLLTDVAAFMRDLVEKVVARMNEGQMPYEIYHAVEPDPVLAAKPYLKAFYDHPKFVVRNILRQYGGWWSGQADELLPASPAEQAKEVAELAGGVEAIVARGRSKLANNELKLAAHLAEWATRAEPSNQMAQEFKRDVYERRMKAEKSLMARGIFRHSANQAREALGEKPLRANMKLSFG